MLSRLNIRNLKLVSIYQPKDFVARQFTDGVFASGWFVRVNDRGLESAEICVPA